jgi:integrase
MQPQSKIRFALVFNRTGNLNRYGEGLIQVRAYQGGRYRLFSTGIYVQPKKWSERTQRVKIAHPNHFVHNQRIMQQLQLMEAFEIKMINRFGGLSLDRMHEYAEVQQERPKSFTAFYEHELEEAGYKESSHKMYKLTLTKIKAFRKVLYFEDLTYKTILDFDRWLKRQPGLGGSSIYKHHVRLRTFIKAAIRHDYIKVSNDPYTRFRPVRGEEPNRPYLNADELASVEALQLEDEVLERIRDLFLFCCYTGLRFGDAIRLNVSNIEHRDKGLVLRMIAEKTDKPLELPLYFLFQDGDEEGSRPERIIKKYLAELGQLASCTGAERIRFFPYTNQYVNRTLKQIATLAGINKNVSTHVARRTFGTQMATRVKSPVLQKLMQHSRPDMTAIYIRLGNGEIETELEKIQWHERRK